VAASSRRVATADLVAAAGDDVLDQGAQGGLLLLEVADRPVRPIAITDR
jgi:hypothetical protein